MPTKPPQKPKDASPEELEEYSQKLEKYFKNREKEIADQQKEARKTLADLDREKANVQLKEREAEELREKTGALEASLNKQMEDLTVRIKSH